MCVLLHPAPPRPPRLPALSTLSVRCESRGSAILQHRRGWRIPHLHLQPPWLLAPSPPLSPIIPPGSLVPPAPPWSGVLSSGCASLLHPTGSVGLLPPVCSTWVLSRSGAATYLRTSAYASVARALAAPWPPGSSASPLVCRLSVSTSGSSTTCSTAVGRPPGVGSHLSCMTPPSVGSTLGHHHGCGLGPAVCLLLQVPPGSSLLHHFPGLCLPTPSRVSILLLSLFLSSPLPFLLNVTTVRGRIFRKGDDMSGLWTVFCMFCSPCVPCDPVFPSC